ncbi:MAG: hypothetical protein LAT67_03485 [Balneolales bacterium]|nr:hypothetical protein [Balneolales bacterium]
MGIISFLPATAAAQMFSVSSSVAQNRPFEMPAVAGPALEFTDLSFFGPNSFEGDNLIRYNFNGPLYRAVIETPGFMFSISDGTSLGEDKDIRATRLGIAIKSPALIAAGNNYRLTIPFSLSTDYTLVRTSETANSNRELAQNSGYIGAGLGFLYRFTDSFYLNSISAPHFGFTVGSYGATGGISYKLNQDIRFALIDIWRGYGLVTGYSLQFIRFNNSDPNFKYDWLSHTFLIGVSF